MKRIIPILVVLVLVISLTVVSVCAAETYYFDTSTFVDVPGYDGFRYNLPDGRYTMTFHIPDTGDPDIPSGDLVSDPFDLVFYNEDGFLSVSLAPEFSSGFIDTFPFMMVYYPNNPDILVVLVPEGDDFQVYDGSLPFTLTRLDSDPPSLSGIVDSGMMSGVLDQVVSILPVVLVVIVAFIGIRKGIGFLRDLLASS